LRRSWKARSLLVVLRVLSVMAMVLLVGACAGQRVPASAQVAGPSEMPSFAPLVLKVLPAVVSLSAPMGPGSSRADERPRDAEPDAPDPGSPTLEELLRRFSEQLAPQPDVTEVAVGSGFIIDPEGDIVTDDHIVADAREISVTLQDGIEYPAKVVGRDPLTDLALLKIDVSHPLPYVEWGDSDAVQVGDWVLAIGNPYHLGGTISPGVLSARNRDIQIGSYDDFLQIDASINRGNSGGPAFDLHGHVIGIVTAIYTPSGGSVGISFAIPSRLARPVIEQLRLHGKVTRGWLGLKVWPLTPEVAQSLGLHQPIGVLVAGVTAGGAAEKAGFQRGDVILSVNGHAMAKTRDLQRLVAALRPGESASVTLWRHGREMTLRPVVEEMPELNSLTTGG